jgi:hypothetical protein
MPALLNNAIGSRAHDDYQFCRLTLNLTAACLYHACLHQRAPAFSTILSACSSTYSYTSNISTCWQLLMLCKYVLALVTLTLVVSQVGCPGELNLQVLHTNTSHLEVLRAADTTFEPVVLAKCGLDSVSIQSWWSAVCYT